MSYQEHIAQENLLDDIFQSEFEMFFDETKTDSDLLWDDNTPPVSVQEFVESPNFLDMKGALYPAIQYVLNLIEQPDIREADLMFGKGSGKTTVIQIFMAYELYKLLKLRNPWSYYGLIKGTPISTLLVSINKEQAQEVGFRGVKNLLDQCAWFKGKYDPQSMRILFPNNVTFYCGSSSGTSKLGFNSLICAMDEVDYMKDSSEHSVAQELYEMLKGSLVTRYPGKFKLLCVSSPKDEDSFLTRRFNLIRNEGTPIDLPDSIDVSRNGVDYSAMQQTTPTTIS